LTTPAAISATVLAAPATALTAAAAAVAAAPAATGCYASITRFADHAMRSVVSVDAGWIRGIKLGEVLLESLPQAVTQSYILIQMVRDDIPPSWWQWLTITVSLLAIGFAVATTILADAPNKAKVAYFLVAPLTIASRVVTCCLISKVYGGWFALSIVGEWVVHQTTSGITMCCMPHDGVHAFCLSWFFLLDGVTVPGFILSLFNLLAAVLGYNVYWWSPYSFETQQTIAIAAIALTAATAAVNVIILAIPSLRQDIGDIRTIAKYRGLNIQEEEEASPRGEDEASPRGEEEARPRGEEEASPRGEEEARPRVYEDTYEC
ncbi:unnamed protein product, partial [Meganyctiphanes norvegica]